MKVLGVDPSSRAIGLAMMEGDRLLWARSFALRGSLDQRMAGASKVISDTLEVDRPEVVVQETPGPWTRGKAGSTTHTVEVLAKVRGIIFAAVLAYDLPCHEMTVNRARHLVLGKGNAKKHVVMASVKLLGYDVPDDDAADAVVVALAWQAERRLEGMAQAQDADVRRCVGRQGGSRGDVAGMMPSLPAGTFQTIVADPPWAYRDKLPRKQGAATNYDVLTLADIAALPVGKIAGANAHLYLWVTTAMIMEGYQVAVAWGFTPKSFLTWHKTGRLGLGRWFRNDTEHIIFAVRGKLKLKRKDARNIFAAPARAHSEKPEEFIALVESCSPGPYLELFSRKLRPGWTTWGNEIDTANSKEER